MFPMLTRLGCAALLFTAVSPAITIFTDGFESSAAGINATPNGWTLARSSVDVLAQSGSFNCHTGVRCVDMDGTSLAAGRIESPDFTFAAGLTYTLTFWVSQNQRGFYGPDSMTACLGTECATLTLAESAPGTNTWAVHTLTLIGTGTVGRLSFDHAGGDNVGLILDDITLADSSAPEPGTLALLGAGLGWLWMRRRA